MKEKVSFEFLGNQNGCTVQKIRPDKGDGDIGTSKDSKTYAKVYASLSKVGEYAWDLSVKYYVMEPTAFDGTYSKSKQDGLYFQAKKRIDISRLVKSGYKLVLDNDLSGQAYYVGWWKGTKSDWCSIDYDDYKTTNNVQTWLPMTELRCKVDGKGSELNNVGNLAIKGNVVIIYHYESTVLPPGSTPKKPEPTTIASPTDIDSFIQGLSKANLSDGFEELPIINTEFLSGREGTYVRGVRTPKYGENVFKFPFNNSNYYLGKILLVDNNDTFFSKAPTELPLANNQRKNIEIIAKFGNYTLTPKDLGYSTNSVVPYENDMAIMLDKLMVAAKKRAKAEGWRLPLINTQPTYYNFDHSDGINIGGTIKGVSFGVDFTKSKSITILEYKQPLFSLSLNDKDINASDYIQNVSLDKLQKMCTCPSDGYVKSPAIIETVYYGKSVYIIATNEKSGISFNVGDFIKDGKCGGSDKWKFQAYVQGGGTEQLPEGYMKPTEFQKIVNAACKPLTADDIEVSAPIEFEATHLSDRRKVKLDILQYYRRYVEKIDAGFTESNSGASMNVTINYLEPTLNADKKGYTYMPQSRSGKMGQYFNISPWALAIEVIVGIVGVKDEYDFNYFIPNMCFEKLRVDENGKCQFRCVSTGSNYWDAKRVDISPMPTGCYLSKNDSIRGVTQYCRNNGGNSEKGILKKFFEWCEKNASTYNSFKSIGAERDDMSGNSRN